MTADRPGPTDPPTHAPDIGSDRTLDGRMLATLAPERGDGAPLAELAAPAAEPPPELDRSGLGPRERALVVSRYVLLSRLGAGGMGLVYLAHDPALERKVAVKLLRPGGEDREQAAEAHARLHREAQALAKLSHPNVVAVHDVGTYDASPLYGEGARAGEATRGVFVVMDYLEGVTLADWLAGPPRPWPALLRVFLAAGRGLIAAHAVGVIHRDFKPSNVLVRSDGAVQVFDFGLARAASEPEDPAPLARPRTLHDTWMSSLSRPLTLHGAYVGTPAYTAPEQRGGGQVDERCDQFSFCVALHEGLYGNRPFSGDNIPALELAKLTGRLDPPQRRPRLPRRLVRAVLRGLSPDPRDRWPTMSALLAELERLLPRHRPALLAALGVGLLGAAVGLAAATRGPACTGAAAALDGAWGEAPRAALTRAFTATGLAYAEDTARRVGARLDDYRERWLAGHTEACEATRVRGSQSPARMERRLRCLEQRRDELRALLGVFAAADAEVVAHAVTAAAALPAPERCADPGLLARDEAQPADPARAAELAARRRDLATAAAESSAGHYAAAEALAIAVLGAAETAEDRDLRAEARERLGREQINLTAFADAEQTLSAAFFDALARARDDLAVEIGVTLANLVGDQLARPAEGRLWARHVDALLDRDGRSPRAEARYLDALGNIATRSGEYPVAEAAYRDALARVEALEPRDDLALAHALAHLAGVLGIIGKPAEAVALDQRALALREAALGPLHPDLGLMLTNLGVGHMLLGEHARAEQAQRRALEIWRVSLPPGHERLAFPLSALGDLALEHARFDEARADFQEALALWERSLGPGHPSALFMQERLATTLLIQGERAAALQHSERALAGWDLLGEPDPGGLTLALLTRAQIAITVGDLDGARTPLARALSTAEAAFGPTHLYTLAARMLDAGRALEAGAPAQALADLRPVLADLEREHGPDSRWLVETLILLGRARHGAAQAGPDAAPKPAAQDELAAARRDLERAHALTVKHQLPALQAEAELALARLQWDASPPGPERDAARRRAHALATDAAAAQRRLGAREALRQTEDWLRAHPAP